MCVKNLHLNLSEYLTLKDYPLSAIASTHKYELTQLTKRGTRMLKLPTPLTEKQEFYSDFKPDLSLSPVNQDILRTVNEEAVKSSIRNLLLTNKGERPFQPELGCDIRRMLFENITPDQLLIMQDMVKTTIQLHEKRAEVLEVKCTTALDSNSVEISVTFHVLNKQDPVNMTIQMERIR